MGESHSRGNVNVEFKEFAEGVWRWLTVSVKHPHVRCICLHEGVDVPVYVSSRMPRLSLFTIVTVLNEWGNIIWRHNLYWAILLLNVFEAGRVDFPIEPRNRYEDFQARLKARASSASFFIVILASPPLNLAKRNKSSFSHFWDGNPPWGNPRSVDSLPDSGMVGSGPMITCCGSVNVPEILPPG